MDHFDDLQIEDISGDFDFVEELFEEEEDNKKSFDNYLNSNIDYWLWTLMHLISLVMLLLTLVS